MNSKNSEFYPWIRLACAIVNSALQYGDDYFFKSKWGEYLVSVVGEEIAMRDEYAGENPYSGVRLC